MSQPNLRRILLVDDEPHIVAAVRRELRLPPNDIYDYAVEEFSDPVAALARCREVKFDAVISDYRMPGMDGVEFIKRMNQLHPDCARIVLSGQTDTPALVRMVNELGIYRFIPKPWNPYYLKATLGQAIDYSEVFTRNRELSAAAGEMDQSGDAAGRNMADRLLLVGDGATALPGVVQNMLGRPDADPAVPSIEIQVAESAAQALALIDADRFSCIIAHQSLPDMAGVDLLSQVAQRQPDCLRILLGAGIGQDALVKAVNVAHIFAFIEKPWSDLDLQKTLLQCLQRRRMALENRRLADLLQHSAVPPAPTFHEIDPDDDLIKRG
jgi:DNA-binding NtrC family response regulator